MVCQASAQTRRPALLGTGCGCAPHTIRIAPSCLQQGTEGSRMSALDDIEPSAPGGFYKVEIVVEGQRIVIAGMLNASIATLIEKMEELSDLDYKSAAPLEVLE